MKALLLDVGGVLLVPDPFVVRTITVPAGGTGDPESLIRAHYVAAMAADDMTRWRPSLYFERLAVEAEVPAAVRTDTVDRLRKVYAGSNIWRYPFPGSRDALARHVDAGTRVAIVSNADGNVERLLAESGTCQVGPGEGVPVDTVLDSTVVGISKPDPAIFELALSRLGVDAGDAVHVGDMLHADIAGARASGVRVVHFDPYDLCGTPDGHAHSRTLDPAAISGRQ